jgi:hypothetical protein
MRHAGPVLALAVVSVLLLGANLGVRRAQPGEQLLKSTSSAIARNGWQDADGRFLPLLVHADGERWLTPVPVYALALMQKIRPSMANPGRWIAVLTGVVDIVLMYLLANQVFRQRWLGLVAGVALLLTPAHASYSRVATVDGVWQLPFVLAWLVALTAVLHSPGSRPRLLAAGVAALALSVYAQPSAALMALAFLVLTMILLHQRRGLTWVDSFSAVFAFGAGLLPLLFWFARYPSTYLDTFARWFLSAAHLRHPLVWAQAATNWLTMQVVAERYWDFVSPFHLFINAQAPGLAGVFLLPVGILMLVGAYTTLRDDGKNAKDACIVALVGLVAVPLVAATFGDARAVQRALVIAPLGVLLATAGVEAIWATGTTRSRIAAVVLCVAGSIQFAWYYQRSLQSAVT